MQNLIWGFRCVSEESYVCFCFLQLFSEVTGLPDIVISIKSQYFHSSVNPSRFIKLKTESLIMTNLSLSDSSQLSSVMICCIVINITMKLLPFLMPEVYLG
jgi:hypothetical protein